MIWWTLFLFSHCFIFFIPDSQRGEALLWKHRGGKQQRPHLSVLHTAPSLAQPVTPSTLQSDRQRTRQRPNGEGSVVVSALVLKSLPSLLSRLLSFSLLFVPNWKDLWRITPGCESIRIFLRWGSDLRFFYAHTFRGDKTQSSLLFICP